MLIIASVPCLSAQNFLSKERENEIKMLGKYYWGECSDFQEGNAQQCAFAELSNCVIGDAVVLSIKRDEVLKAIEMGANFDRLQQKGKIKILAWIAKDSVFVTITKPITHMPVETTADLKTPQPDTEPLSETDVNSVATNNLVLQKLIDCKTVRDVERVSKMNGLVRGSEINSSKGFANPAKCIIAVFTADGTLSALLDTGSSSRIDLLSGKTVQNPEQTYNKDEYFLWYLQQK